MAFTLARLSSFAAIAALLSVGSPNIFSFSGSAGQVSAQENKDADNGALSDRLRETRKAVEHAEQRLKHAQLTGEGLQAAKMALAAAKQELKTVELEAQSTGDDPRTEGISPGADQN